MDFSVTFLPSDSASIRRYHLFDDSGKLALIADYGTPWLPFPQKHVRFALPSAVVVATMDLTWEEKGRGKGNGRQHIAYAIIKDHAVYAIINKYAEPDSDKAYFVLEVGDMLWLVLGKDSPDRRYNFYDQLPSDLLIHHRPNQLDLPEPIGHLYKGLGVYDYNVVIPEDLVADPDLLSLALIFLIDYIAEG